MRILARNALLAALFAGLVAANVLLERPEPQASSGGPLVPGFDPDAVARIEVAGAAGRLTIERDAEDVWRLLERGGFPTFGYAVDELLTGVENLARGDRVSSERASHDLYGVGAEGTRIVLSDAAGRPLAHLVQGAPTGLLAGSFVRLAGADDVYRAPAFPPVPAEAVAWLETRLLPLDGKRVQAMTVSHDAGRVLVDLRRDGGGWRVLGPAPRGSAAMIEARAARVLTAASSLVFTDLVEGEVDPAHGFGTPPRTMVEVELHGGAREAVWIGVPVEGSEDSGGLYFATSTGWDPPRLATVSSTSAELLFAAIDSLAAAL